MQPPDADRVLVRQGEIGVKSEPVRRRMERRLRETVRAQLDARGLAGTLEQRRFRLLVHTAEPDAVAGAVTDTFGVVSASPATATDAMLPSIERVLADTARACFEGGSFAVRADRAGDSDTHPFSSHDIEREGGSAVWDALEGVGADPAVDLEDPDLELFVDCRPTEAFVFVEKRAGPAGLPLGTQDPVVALLSGGIDSPVAAWKLMKRGCPIVPLYVGLGDYGGVDRRARARSTVDSLAQYAPEFDMRLRFAPAGETIDHIVKSVSEGRMLVHRRFLLLVAEFVAEQTGAVGIVTGESIGQKSSQTSANLAATSAVTDLPVHRPLLTEDKTDICALAREIGTYEESTIPAGCNRLAPEHPMTAASAAEISRREPDDLRERARAVADRIELLPGAATSGKGETA